MTELEEEQQRTAQSSFSSQLSQIVSVQPEYTGLIIGKNKSNLKHIAEFILKKTCERPYIKILSNSTFEILATKPETIQSTIDYILIFEDSLKFRNKQETLFHQSQKQPFHKHQETVPTTQQPFHKHSGASLTHEKCHNKNYFKFDRTPPPPLMTTTSIPVPPLPMKKSPISQKKHVIVQKHPSQKTRPLPNEIQPLPIKKVIDFSAIPEYIPKFAQGKTTTNA